MALVVMVDYLVVLLVKLCLFLILAALSLYCFRHFNEVADSSFIEFVNALLNESAAELLVCWSMYVVLFAFLVLACTIPVVQPIQSDDAHTAS